MTLLPAEEALAIAEPAQEAAMKLLPTGEQAELRKMVRTFLDKESPLAAVRAVMATEAGYDTDVWRRLSSELGVTGIAVPTASGGQGCGITELAVVMEECGAALLPGPLLGSAVLCGLVLDAIGERDLLPRIAAGALIGALIQDPSVTVTADAASGTATSGDAASGTAASGTAAPGNAASGTVASGTVASGTAAAVLDGMNAGVLIVIAAGGVYAVDAAGPGVDRVPLTTMDLTRRQAQIRLDRAPARRIGDAGPAGRGLDRAAVALAAEQLGVMRRAVEMAVSYAKVREQFGRTIGSFQAVKHGLAEIYASYELAIGAVAYAAWAADHAPAELPVAASLARAYLSPQAFEATFQMVQYHGGIGYTWEHDAHLYFKRAKTSETLLGDTGTHLDRLAAHLLDEPAHLPDHAAQPHDETGAA